jgi:septum formation protein
VESAALAKAAAVGAEHPDSLVLGADTLVVVGERALGKPSSPGDAVTMLRALSGQIHLVYTGLALVRGQVRRVGHEVTEVDMRPFDEEEIAAYVATGEPRDKAGGYGIQGKGALLVRSITGDYYNVVGLPLARLGEMLKEFGVRAL